VKVSGPSRSSGTVLPFVRLKRKRKRGRPRKDEDIALPILRGLFNADRKRPAHRPRSIFAVGSEIKLLVDTANTLNGLYEGSNRLRSKSDIFAFLAKFYFPGFEPRQLRHAFYRALCNAQLITLLQDRFPDIYRTLVASVKKPPDVI
jgi:hypothetical protein